MQIEIDIEPLAQALAKRAMEIIAEYKFAPPPDPLLTTRAIAMQLCISEQKVRELVAMGYLKKAPGIIDIRVRRSVVDSYATASQQPVAKERSRKPRWSGKEVISSEPPNKRRQRAIFRRHLASCIHCRAGNACGEGQRLRQAIEAAPD